MTTPAITSSSSIFSSGIVSPDHLTPDGMVMYLQSRLGSLDEQIDAIMIKQKASEAARKALQRIQNELSTVGEEGGAVNVQAFTQTLNEVSASMGPKAAAELFANLPESVRNEIKGPGDAIDEDGNPIEANNPGADGNPNGAEPYTHGSTTAQLGKQDVKALGTYIENAIKDVESGSELEMIKLQSLMSARNTAISLATNMMSAIGKGAEAIVGNIGR